MKCFYYNPPELGSYSGFNIGGGSWLRAVGNFVINAGAFTVQAAKYMAAQKLWMMTARPNTWGQEEGVIAVRHQCPDQTIVYVPTNNNTQYAVTAAAHFLGEARNHTQASGPATTGTQLRHS